jgi:hypothetical protein
MQPESQAETQGQSQRTCGDKQTTANHFASRMHDAN